MKICYIVSYASERSTYTLIYCNVNSHGGKKKLLRHSYTFNTDHWSWMWFLVCTLSFLLCLYQLGRLGGLCPDWKVTAHLIKKLTDGEKREAADKLYRQVLGNREHWKGKLQKKQSKNRHLQRLQKESRSQFDSSLGSFPEQWTQRNQKAEQGQGVTRSVCCVQCFKIQKYIKGNIGIEKEKQQNL